jgi:hypothetical protein
MEVCMMDPNIKLLWIFNEDIDNLLHSKALQHEGFGPYNIKTINYALRWFLTLKPAYFEVYGTDIPLPKMMPGTGTDVDLEWETNEIYLSIGFPEDRTLSSGYYGYVKNKGQKENDEIADDFFGYDYNKGEIIKWLKRNLI